MSSLLALPFKVKGYVHFPTITSLPLQDMVVSRRKLLLGLFLISVVAIVTTWVICPETSNSHRTAAASRWYLYRKSATKMASMDESNHTFDSFKIAYLGNSIQYYNDMPRLLEHMLKRRFKNVRQDSCLRGGATIPSLWEKGNGMARKFATDAAKKEDGTYDIGAPTVQALLGEETWDVVIVNDHTQSPARPEKRAESMQALKEQYIPMCTNNKVSKIIFLQTAAYKTPVKDSGDLGTFDEFTEKVWHGYQEYAKLVRQEGKKSELEAKVAPVGMAYQAIRKQDHDLWARLYARDDFHPSLHGTFLEASVVYCTIVGEKAPVYDSSWWKTARYMQPPDTDPLPLPTDTEAATLRDVAWNFCQTKDR